ncbi:zinc knuckle domain containing protein, putative [Babesia bigemina]|uniref:Zinc knuckle domain containing protein, putative n=1 Tax=Babesia bigemina TaxID=5866 RepID=A0A061DC84_BABBI|nr:zinc knuckle domain containing protein, putative [Babesia bigemina]CDR95395.1 zinc knuckle domain containing protein, putative [Babesia bigemina]|eukprot:XP_012767581.1 zinc knuckle domain containing protein, putative [Babesia bigemina]
MHTKYNRTYSGCWDREKIEAAIRSRQAELEGDAPKTASRIQYLKRKIAKLRRALEDGTPIGGNILPQKRSKPGNPSAAKRPCIASTARNDAILARRHKRIKKICFKCRKRGHTLQDCDEGSVGICFRCGSTDHILRDCIKPDEGSLRFASCFVCEQTGHIASQCPQNNKGIYPNGGACFFCGSVSHRKAECAERKKKVGD